MTTNLKLNTANWFKKQLLLLGLFILAILPLVGHAQQYPVRIIPVITPPYSLKLADYAHAPESKLQLQVLMTDLQQPQHHTGIKFFLQAGLNAQPIAQSNEFVIGQRPFLLTPGTNITLTSSQLKYLFDPQNLNGLNPQQYASPLPEGLYQFCFQAYDFYTKNNLSEKACASVFLNQYDPPQLNIPQNAEKIQAINPYGNGSGILFQWMPRQVAPNTKYNFILKEIWDTNQSPISAFLASPVLWKEETFAPNLYYSIDKTQLIPGRRYAWQVQAFSSNPFDNFNNFTNSQIQSANYKNNGLSEIFFFDYVENCQTPTFLMAKNKGRGRVEIHWNFLGNPAGLYKIQYRKKGANTPWMHTEAYQNSAFISGLEDLTEYEYRVGAVCGNVAISNSQFENNENAYAFSPVQFFTTDSQDVQNNNFQCGVMPAVDISNKEPLRQSLVANDIFTAGDFPVTIIEAQGSNGIFTGTGFIQVPYLADTKIKVAFNNISINSDKKLISGTVETEYDPNESAVHFASTGLGELFGDSGIKDITLDYNVSNVQFIATPPPGKIIIVGDNGKGNNSDTGSGTGSTQELPAGRDYTIVDKNGNVWSVDEDGNITSGGTLADGGKSTPQNTDGVDANGSANAITAKGIKVDFENASNSKYAFDKPKKLISNDYKEISGYIIPFKAVENKETEPFIAKISITDDSVKADSLIFKTSKGVAIEAKKIDGTNDFKLTLKGTYSYDKEEIQAVIKQNGKYQIAGVFNLVHISPKTIKLNLVPTTGVKIADETIAQIKNIYSKVAINLDITTKPEFDIKDFLVNNKLPTEDEFGDLSTYSPAQNNIISKYMADNKDVGLEYYIFVTDKPSSSGQGGYMRLNGQFGFVFNQSARTIAHELAHGALKLEHPFKLFKNLNKGDTSSIMDYAEGTNFIFPEWKQINDPKLKLYAFQEQKEGEFNGGYVISPDYQIFTIGVENTIVDKTNYTLNSKAANDGTLPGFKLGGIDYWWDYNTNKYISSDTDKKGYEIKNVSNNLASIKDSNLFLFFDKDKDCGKGTYVYIKISDSIKSKKDVISLIASYSNASYGIHSEVVELGKKEFVACNSENLTWKKKSENTHSNQTYGNCNEDNIKRHISIIDTITTSTTAQETNKILKENYQECIFKNIDIDKRIIILDNLLKDDVDDSQWEFSNGTFSSGDTFFLDDLILSTPETDRLKLLKDGFMKNNYKWLEILFNKSKGSSIINNDSTMLEIVPLFRGIASWVATYYSQLNIPTTMHKIVDIGPSKFNIYEYPAASVNPVYLGASDDGSGPFDFVEIKDGIKYKPQIIGNTFIQQQGNKFNFTYSLRKIVDGVYITTPNNTPKDIFEPYSLSVNPFEPVIMISSRNYQNLGIEKGKEYTVPAFLAASYEQFILDNASDENVRSLGNAIAITAAIIAIPETGGGSYAAYLALAGGVISSVDIALKNDRLKLNQDPYFKQKYESYYQAWENFYTAFALLEGGTGVYSLANNIRKINFIKATKDFHSQMKNFDNHGELMNVWKALGSVDDIDNSVLNTAKYTLVNISKEQGFIDLLPELLKKEGLTMDDFHYMMQKNANALTSSEIKKLTNIRNAIPKPDANTLMQKVIPKDAINNYLREIEPYTTIGGFVTRASDAKHLKTYDDLYFGLRLDYINDKGKLVNFVEDSSCGVIRFKTKSTSELYVPKEELLDGNKYPYTGHGFTSGKQGRIGVPEFKFRDNFYAKPEEGAELWEVFSDGRQIPIAVYEERNGIKRFYKINK